MSLFLHPQLDEYLLPFLDLEILISLLHVNRYYWNLIRKTKYFRIILFYVKNKRNLTKTFVNECGHGTLETVRWIYDQHRMSRGIFSKKQKRIKIDKEAFLDACKYGKLEIAQYLFDKKRQLGDLINLKKGYAEVINVDGILLTTTRIITPIWISLLRGHLDLATWLYERNMESPDPWDLDSHDGELYFRICRQGDLRKVKWLFDRKIPRPDICIEALLQVSGNGHLDIAQYIYGLGVVSVSDPRFQHIIETVCEHMQWKVAKWLISLVDPND